ncbi:oxidoreductase [Blyttiomyces helicus]|uniref:Oxidoreductase n=1 Tax=Blyttiomyces helicus TaxID=388810 RepID=A0A4P9W866_9FUNG|nr:oxidoreductase [Blyttiomyces helicus]|eukprot:RKO87633.1 oxidoreductase [Blyttiomyces helicus]
MPSQIKKVFRSIFPKHGSTLPAMQTAIGQLAKGGVDTLQEVQIPVEKPTSTDILVSVKAVSVNPIDYKLRARSDTTSKVDGPFVMGYDASGIVEAVGDKVTLFKKGDEVFYSGSATRSGSNATYQLVDERIVALKPKTWSHTDSAALPLVSLAAWEAMVESMAIPVSETENPKSILIINGAGGVGTVALTLASKVLKLKTVIATASRPETVAWAKKFGATHVINHTLPLGPQLEEQGLHFDYAFICGGTTDKNLTELVPLINPLGKIASILPAESPLALQAGMMKSISFHWALMFVKSMTNTRPETQGQILKQIAAYADAGVFSNDIVTERYKFDVEGLRTVHTKLEGGKTIGKIVLARE